MVSPLNSLVSPRSWQEGRVRGYFPTSDLLLSIVLGELVMWDLPMLLLPSLYSAPALGHHVGMFLTALVAMRPCGTEQPNLRQLPHSVLTADLSLGPLPAPAGTCSTGCPFSLASSSCLPSRFRSVAPRRAPQTSPHSSYETVSRERERGFPTARLRKSDMARRVRAPGGRRLPPQALHRVD